jgi:DNA replication and repair protein RecF
MKLDKVQISQFRNIESATIYPSPHLNVVVGQNGSGKSSFLESLHYLGFGRSFRTNKHRSVIQSTHSQFSVFAECTDNKNETHKIGLMRNSKDEFLCSINGERSQRLANLVSYIPVQIFTPQSTDLLLGSPTQRRRFLDWGLFHVEQSFYDLSIGYAKVLKQRNALLKMQQTGKKIDSIQLDYWSLQLAIYGEKIDDDRQKYISALKLIFKRISEQFLPEFSLEISYNRGWDKSIDFISALKEKTTYDSRMGFTSVGIHKADIKIKADGIIAIERLSRGQLRMLVAALQLSQTLHLFETTNKSGIFLLDDIGAELDLDKRKNFIEALLATNTQLFVTAIEKSHLSFVEEYNDKKMFHVEHGHVEEEQ